MKLRDYQIKINDSTIKFINSDEQRAQVYAPTGAGKTVCFTELMKNVIANGATNIAVAHPRIALSQDQLRRLKKDLGVDVHFTSFHSGKHIPGEEAIAEINTTNVNDLVTIIDQTDRPHITFSSYHSFNKLNESGIHFDLIVCDEAHYLAQDVFGKLLLSFKADKIVFYTATPVSRFEGERTMPVSLFGEVIAEVPPKDLIKAGYIVAPLIHLMECDSNKNSDSANIVDIVKRSYVEQYSRTNGWGMPYHQMLVAARNVECDLKEIEDKLYDIFSYIGEHTDIDVSDLKVYTIAADYAQCNGRLVSSRDEAIKQIKNEKKNVIVCHYDTLSEGIDIDTLSGCVILRKLSQSKFIQTIGRCARPYGGDLDPDFGPKKELYDFDKLQDQRAKPRCVVTIPVIDGDIIAGPEYKTIAEAFIIGGYGDIGSYVPDQEKYEGKGDSEFKFPNEEELTYSGITNHVLTEELTDIYEMMYEGV